MTPLAIDLFAGLGGWAEGLLAEGYRVIGFDTVRHIYGEDRYPGQLVIQDVLTLHGTQFKDAALIVASPPCQAYSYRAMPWKKAKALPPPDNALFEACFRIQREAQAAVGRFIPMVVENVCGAQKWIGRARWHYGSFYLWGDVPALMPITTRAKVGGFSWSDFGKPSYKAQAFNGTAERRLKTTKNDGGSWFNIGSPGQKETGRNPVHELTGLKVPSLDGGRRTDVGKGVRFTSRDCDGIKQHGSNAAWFDTGICKTSSKSSARQAASAHIAKIPFTLAQHIARAWYPICLRGGC